MLVDATELKVLGSLEDVLGGSVVWDIELVGELEEELVDCGGS